MVKDPFTQELDTMAIIGQLLGKLPDVAARHRVIKWVVERHSGEAVTSQQHAAALAANAVDASLSVDSLDDIFRDSSLPHVDDAGFMLGPPVENHTAKAPLQKVLQSFSQDFQRFVEEWKGSAA